MKIFYRRVDDQTHYDVVVVGGGLGGLLTALLLSKEGAKVCVLEKNKQIGGCLQTFGLHKKKFDACVHYIGGLGEGHSLNTLYRYAGLLDDLKLIPLDPRGYDRVRFGEEPEEYPHACGPESFVERLAPFFPGERPALEQYIATVNRVVSKMPLYNLRSGTAAEKAGVAGLELCETLASITPNQRLRDVLAGTNMLYAGVPGRTPFPTHAVVLHSYMHSSHKISLEGPGLATVLRKTLRAQGAEIFREADVVQLHCSGSVVEWAQTRDGRRFYGKRFIAAIPPDLVFRLTGGASHRRITQERVATLRQTPPAMMLNIVLKPGTTPYQPSNLYWHPDGEVFPVEGANGLRWPRTTAFYFTADGARPGRAESVTLLRYADPEQFAAWEETENITGIGTVRAQAYADRKARISEEILALADRAVPGLGEAAEATSLATPLTFRDYTASPGGSLYGISPDLQAAGGTELPIRTRIPNLLMTGQNVAMHGVLGVSLTAVATCAEILGMDYLLGKINGARRP